MKESLRKWAEHKHYFIGFYFKRSQIGLFLHCKRFKTCASPILKRERLRIMSAYSGSPLSFGLRRPFMSSRSLHCNAKRTGANAHPEVNEYTISLSGSISWTFTINFSMVLVVNFFSSHASFLESQKYERCCDLLYDIALKDLLLQRLTLHLS